MTKRILEIISLVIALFTGLLTYADQLKPITDLSPKLAHMWPIFGSVVIVLKIVASILGDYLNGRPVAVPQVTSDPQPSEKYPSARNSQMLKMVFPLCTLFLFASCAQFSTGVTKLSAWNKSENGRLALSSVALAASVFAPQFAGPIGIAISSLEIGTLPTPANAASIIASLTGSSISDQRVAALASAVVAAAASAPTPNAGLLAAAATVNK